MKNIKQISFIALLLIGILSILFFKSFHSDYVLFSNDGPLGALNTAQVNPDNTLNGIWADTNWLGVSAETPGPSISFGLRYILYHCKPISIVYFLFIVITILISIMLCKYDLRIAIRRSVGISCFLYMFGMIFAMIFASIDFLFFLLPTSGMFLIFMMVMESITEQTNTCQE